MSSEEWVACKERKMREWKRGNDNELTITVVMVRRTPLCFSTVTRGWLGESGDGIFVKCCNCLSVRCAVS